jgi:predicted pyridoxine 5'-phosphate oxidase superfamily flavin-nucleotide-binding protein
MSIIEKAMERLKLREFVGVATADREGTPNSAPKLLLKTEGKAVYCVDYSFGKTAQNLEVNPKVSLSFIDLHSLFGYKLDGTVEIIEKGALFDECLKELRERQIELTAERLVDGMHAGKPHKEFEVEIPERFLVYKINIKEGSEISPRGEVKRENS